ncbi:MoaB/Mog domain-containing protein [Gongronella butleri]|nr:MoaB/Mog domain-containing protein [Gongronella butleri]
MTSTFTAACCIIGDEILNGKTKDTNTHFLARYLFDMGISLKRVEVVPDEYDAIADSVRRLSQQHNVVFTSGGIGPTLDDITYPAIARAYNQELVLDETTCEHMQLLAQKRQEQGNWELNDARKRMAQFPSGAKILRVHPELWVPVVVVNDNIHILPGIPRLFEQLIHALRPHLEAAMADKDIAVAKFHRAEIATREPEGTIATTLEEMQAKHPDITVGSYPKWGRGPQGERVVVSIVGKDEQAVKLAAAEMTTAISGWTYRRKP